MRKLVTVISVLLLSTVSAESAFAWSFWDCVPVPEIDAGAGAAAMALVASFGAVIHRKIKT